MQIKFENIKKSPWTTVVGAIVMLAGVASVFIPKLGIDWGGAMVPIGLGVTLMFMEDKPRTKAMSLAAILLLAACSGCSTIKVPANKERASRVIAKNIRQNKAIAQAFPELVKETQTKVEIKGVDKDTVYVDVTDKSAYDRIKELESLVSEGCDPEVIIKWKETIKTLPSLYLDSTYVFNGDKFRSYVTLSGGNITNRVTIDPEIIYVPVDTEIIEYTKPSLMDWVLRIVSGLAVVYFVLRKLSLL